MTDLTKRAKGISQSACANGNALTEMMHFYTLHELKKMHVLKEMPLARISPEHAVVLKDKRHTRYLRLGSIDFLVETAGGKLLGIEVLTRPTRGKLVNKLAYAKSVDEFVFVVPDCALGFYRRPRTKVFHKQWRAAALPKEFGSEKLHAWMFDTQKRKFTEKGVFSKIFFTEK